MIIAENIVDFNSLEKEIYKKCCEAGREMIKSMLERLDDKLMQERDRTVYRHKGKRKTTLKTIMGEVEYERAIYAVKGEDGTKRHVFLLDELLGFEKIGFMSELLTEIITKASCEMPYRKAAETIGEMTGQTISHTGVWNVTQAAGQKVDEKERHAAKLAKVNKGVGREEAKLLFEEQDGIWLNLQGKDREKIGKSTEMKIAIAYTGAKKTGKDRYNLVGKVACANFENSSKFYDRKEGVIAETYNIDEIEMRILNGDGANWIKRSITDENVHYQLDTYHRNQAIMKYVGNPDARKLILKLLYSKQIDDLLDVIEAYSNSTEDPKEKENFITLLTYFKNNKDGLTSYKRRELDLPPSSEDDVIYRSCGAMESNVFSIIGRRMKRRRTNWSINGGNNLARLLTLKSTGKLSETLRNLVTCVLPVKYEEEIQTTFSAAQIPQFVGKGWNGFKQANISNSPQWVKNISAFKPLYDLNF